MRTFSVYCLYNKETNEIFYVGSTTRDVIFRVREHFKPSRKEASEKYGVPSTHISANCRGKRKSAGKHNLVSLHWKYV